MRINMLSKAGWTKGHGVLSAFEEQTKLVREGLAPEVEVTVNAYKKADILHFHTINPGFLVRGFFSSAAKIGYVHFLPKTLEGSISLPKWIQKILCWYVVFFYKRMDRLVVVNPSFIPDLVACGIDESKVVYIPNFVDEEVFHPVDDKQKVFCRAQFGLNPEKFTVVCAGQMQKRKGFVDFLETARRLPEMQFVWAGGFSFGKITDGYEEIKLALQNVPANVVLPGIIPREQMNALYNAADVFFLPSFDELFPMTILEAMSCRTPILVRDLELYPCILEGFYDAADNVAGFVQNLERLTDPEEKEKAAQRSYNGHQKYTKESVLEDWKNCYFSLLAIQNAKPQTEEE